MSNAIGFIVEGVVTDNQKYFHVIGRCGDAPICIGDEFESIYAPTSHVGSAYRGLGVESPVRLRVERIQAYERQLAKLGSGMTGTIDLRGEGVEHVVPGAVLKSPVMAQLDSPSLPGRPTSEEPRRIG